jgi:phytoene dehydrogenase-like protein
MNLATLLEEGDFNRPSVEIALDLIYITNEFRVPSSKIVLGKPYALDQRPELPTDANTFVPVEIDPDFYDRFHGNIGFMYQRLGFDVLTPNPDVVLVAPAFPFTMHQLLPSLNAKFGTSFNESDIRDDVIDDEWQSVTLYAADTSLVWIGSIPIVVEGVGNLTGVRVTTTGRMRITTSGVPRVIQPVSA